MERTQTTLRQIIGTKTLQETVEQREVIGLSPPILSLSHTEIFISHTHSLTRKSFHHAAEEIQAIIGLAAQAWGCMVEVCDSRDACLIVILIEHSAQRYEIQPRLAGES